MLAIEYLMGARPGPLPVGDAPPRTLLLGEDVFIHPQEDQHQETVVLYSVPGRAQQPAWFDELEASHG